MVSMTLAQNKLARQLRTASQWVDTDSGLLMLIAMLRFGALLGLSLYFISPDHFPFSFLPWIQAAIVAFGIYIAICFVYTIQWPDILLRHKVKLTQSITEIGFYTLFYYLAQNPRSDIIYLYFIPLFVAFRYLSVWWALAILGLASLNFTTILTFGFANIPDPLDSYAYAQVLAARHFLLVGLTLFYAFRRRHSVFYDVQHRDSELSTAFDAANIGVFVIDHEQRLRFVNRALRRKHGDYATGQSGRTYFQCGDDLLQAWAKPATADLNLQPNLHERSRTFRDIKGQTYPADVITLPLPNGNGTAVGAVALVADVSETARHQKWLERRLERSANRVLDLTQERARWLDTYNEMGHRLAGFVDLAELLQFVVDETRERLGAEASSLFLLNRREDRLVRKATSGVEKQWLPGESYAIGEGIVGSTVVPVGDSPYGQPQRIDAADHAEHASSRYVSQYQAKLRSGQVKHAITVPLNASKGSFGVLRILNKLDEEGDLSADAFTRRDEDFLVTIAAMVAIAVENAKLLYDSQKQMRELQAIHHVSQAVTSSLQKETVLRTIVTAAGRVAGSDHTGIVLVNEGGELETSFEEPMISPLLHERVRPNGVTYQVLKTRRAIFIHDVIQTSQYAAMNGHNAVVQSRGLRSYAGVPIMARDQVLGVLFVHSYQPDAFHHRADLLQVFCNHAATAIDNANLYHKLDEEANMRARRRLSEDLHDIMNVMHGTLVLGTEIQRELVERHKLEAAAQNLDKLTRAAKHTYGSLRRLHEDVRDPILHDQGLIPALRHYAGLLPGMRVHFSTNSGQRVPLDIEYALYRIAQEALTNAHKHANLRDDEKICVKLVRETDHFRLNIVDYGEGLDVASVWDRHDAFGVQSMRQWAQSIGATLDIMSLPGQSTDVCVYGQM